MYVLSYVKKTSVSPDTPEVPDVSGFVNNAVYYISGCPEEIYNGAYTLTDLLTSENQLIFTNGTCYLYHYDMGNSDLIGIQSTPMNNGSTPEPVYRTMLVEELPAGWWHIISSDESTKVSDMLLEFYPDVEIGKFIVSGFTDNIDVNGEYIQTDRKTTGGHIIYSNGIYDIRYTRWETEWFCIVRSETKIGGEYDNFVAEPDYSTLNVDLWRIYTYIYI